MVLGRCCLLANSVWYPDQFKFTNLAGQPNANSFVLYLTTVFACLVVRWFTTDRRHHERRNTVSVAPMPCPSRNLSPPPSWYRGNFRQKNRRSARCLIPTHGHLNTSSDHDQIHLSVGLVHCRHCRCRWEKDISAQERSFVALLLCSPSPFHRPSLLI